jgi:hypothetical protein
MHAWIGLSETNIEEHWVTGGTHAKMQLVARVIVGKSAEIDILS